MLATILSASAAAPHLESPEARTSLRAQAAHFFRYASPLLLLLNAGALIGARAWVGGWQLLDLAAMVAAVAWWPLQEWLFHRALLHLRPRRWFGRTIDPVFARAHRAHHRQPWLVEQTLLPLRVVLALIPLQLLWLVAVPSIGLALTAAASYATYALLYEWVHYLAHSQYLPRSAYFRRIRKNHRLHHFKNENYWYSFTVPHLDRWLNTDPPVAEVETSDSVRTLGVDDAPPA